MTTLNTIPAEESTLLQKKPQASLKFQGPELPEAETSLEVQGPELPRPETSLIL